MKVKIIFLILLAVFSLRVTSESFAETKNKKQSEEKNSASKIEAISPKQIAISGFADIVEELLPAVVNISANQETQPGSSGVDPSIFNELPKSPLFDDLRNQLENQLKNGQSQKKKISSIGSGFIISRDGFIVTNNHVIDDADEITVSLNDGSKYKAKVVGVDKRTDLTLLKINTDKELKFVKFGDSSKSRIGDWVIVIGNPYGLGGSVSVGIVSARAREINGGSSDDFIQTDAAINRGNSGGPMFNVKGEVIGISTAIFSPSGGSVGIGFATPSSSAMQIIKQLKEQGEVTRGWIGVSVQEVSDDIASSMKMEKSKGAFVIEVAKDGPAAKAGIIATDIITKFEDQEITDMKSLPNTVSKYPIGKSAKVTVLRRGKVKTFTVQVAKLKDENVKKSENPKPSLKKQESKPTAQLLGIGLTEISANIKTKNTDQNINGLLVVSIDPKSEAAEKSIMIGDIILSANQVPVASVKELQSVIDEAKKSTKKIFLFVKRGNSNYAAGLSVR